VYATIQNTDSDTDAESVASVLETSALALPSRLDLSDNKESLSLVLVCLVQNVGSGVLMFLCFRQDCTIQYRTGLLSLFVQLRVIPAVALLGGSRVSVERISHTFPIPTTSPVCRLLLAWNICEMN
jgi:hypothetical protein